jgi:hypothetical protein
MDIFHLYEIQMQILYFISGWELLKDPIGATVQLIKNFTLLSETFRAVSFIIFGNFM